MVRVTRAQAATRLNISKSTLDRMIKKGELDTGRSNTATGTPSGSSWMTTSKTSVMTSLGTRMVTSLQPVNTPETTPEQRT